MASVRQKFAAFSDINILVAQDVQIQVPQHLDGFHVFFKWESPTIHGGNAQVQVPELMPITPESRVPIHSNVEEYPLLADINIDIPSCNSFHALKAHVIDVSHSFESCYLPILSNVSQIEVPHHLSHEIIDLGILQSDPQIIFIEIPPESPIEILAFEDEINSIEVSQIYAQNYHISFQDVGSINGCIDVFTPLSDIGIEPLIQGIPETPEITITENLLTPIRQPDRFLGMNYQDRYLYIGKLPPVESGSKIERRKGKLKPINEGAAFKSGKSYARKSASIWDSIFILLQPPLTFKGTDSFLLPHDLYPYQIIGVEFLVNNEHALLADDMGTGKTVMTIVALKMLMQKNKIKKALILCPTSVLSEWDRHLNEWAPELITCFVRGNQSDRKINWELNAHVYVTAYGTLRNDIKKIFHENNKAAEFDVVIVDEAHHIKNPTTNQSKAIISLHSKYRWALTGTPIQNRIEELAAIFKFVHSGLLSDYDVYTEEIMTKVAPYFLRRRKQDVMPDLPPKIRQDLWLEMTSDQRDAYNRVEHDVLIEIEALGDSVTRQHIFAKMQKLKQLCNFLPDHLTSPKMERLRDQIEEITGSRNKVIIFSQYNDEGVIKLEKSLCPYGTAKIIGGQTDIIRRTEIDKFKYREDIQILIANVKSGGEGLNLTEASYVIHFDHWWNPAVMWQAEDRAHRRGQMKTVNIYSYWMLDTIDERIYNLLQQKGLLFENVVDGLAVDNIESEITMEDLLGMLGVKKVEKKKKKLDYQKWRSYTTEQIREELYRIPPTEFEELIRELLHYLGYPNVKVTKKTGDGGIDVISTSVTARGTESVAAQCKRYKGTVGVPLAREFYGAIKDNKQIVKGLLITTGEFTSECINFCIRNEIELISGIQVAEYVKRFGLAVN